MNELSDDIAEELARGYDDPLRFVLWAFPWGESPELSIVPLPEPWASKYPGSKFGPDKWACEVLDEIGQQVRANGFDGIHAVKPIRLAVASGHGIGKGHVLTELIDTPQGVKRFGDLREGDFVFSADGSPTRVLGIPYRGIRPCYKVTFDDGSSTVVSREHLWTVRGRQERRTGSPEWRTLETHELLEKGVKRANGKAMARQWEIPRQGAAQFPEADLPLDPYLVGLLIGNGSLTHGTPSLSISSPEVFHYLDDIVALDECRVQYNANYVMVSIPGILPAAKEAGLFGKKSHEKSIPDTYKFSSVEQRAELFRGLVDSDGEVTKEGSLCYSTTSATLAEDIVWLARSLGGKARVQPTTKQAFYYAPSGERVKGRPCHRVTLTMPREFVCGRYKERVERIKPTIEERYLTRWIDSIEYVGDLDTMCIAVEADDGLYQANDFIVTHNSFLTACLVIWILATRPNCKGVVTANTASQLKTKTFAEISKWLKRSIISDMFEIKAESIEAKEAPEAWRVDAQTCKEENSESFAGQHAASSTSFYIFDEASAVPDVIWEVAEGGLTDGEPMMFVFGNPTRNTGRFRECFGKRKNVWSTRQIDSRSVFITNKEQMEEWRKEYGEDSDFFKVRVKGEFPSQSDKQFIPSDLVLEAARRDMPHNGATCAIIGVDVARFGDDDSVIYTRIGRGWLPIKRFKGLSTTQLVAKVKQHFDEVRALGFPRDRIYINVDEGGVGGGPKDQLRDDGYPVRGIQFGAGADDPKTYARLREEMWGRMKLWLMDGGTIPNDQGLIDDLTAPEYDILPGGQIKLESKKDMKKRGMPSPDSADALALTFAYRIEEYIPLAELEYRNRRSGRRDYDPFACLK